MLAQSKRIVVLGDTSVANHHGCWLVMRRLTEGLEERGLEILYRHSGKNWRADERLVERMRNADAFLINGEGSLHHQSKMLHEYLAAGEFGKELGVPTFLVNTTWSQNGAELTKRASVFAQIYVRESRSVEELGSQGIRSVLVPDLTLTTNCDATPRARNGVLITDSTFKSVSKQLLALTLKTPTAQFFPIVSTDWSRAKPRRRRKRAAQWLLGRALRLLRIRPYSLYRLAVADHDAMRYVERLASAEALLTGRFHSACLALITETPFLAIASNTPKIETLIQDAGLSTNRIIDRKKLDPLSITDQLKNAQFDEVEISNLREYRQAAKASVGMMFDTIAERINR